MRTHALEVVNNTVVVLQWERERATGRLPNFEDRATNIGAALFQELQRIQHSANEQQRQSDIATRLRSTSRSRTAFKDSEILRYLNS